MGRRRIVIALLVLVLAVVAFAWIDGGREEPHMIEQPVELPGTAR